MATGATSDQPQGDAEPLRLRFDAFELDEADARLTRDGQPLALAPKAFALLCALARQPGLLMTKNALLDAVWGHQHVSESVLKTVVSELRATLADDPKRPRYIETASRRGYRFVAVPLAAGASPPVALPGLGGGDRPMPRPRPSMVGRQVALSQLGEAWNRARAGQRQVLWITGEAGVGKTTLIDHFVAGVDSSACAIGQCVEQYGAGEPYLPLLEALGLLARHDTTLVPLLRAVAPTWLLQWPWLGNESDRDALRRELAGVGQDRMLRELGELLDRHTRERPLLIVTEDLHWSDQATVHAINHIARRRSPARLMWLASFRLAEVIAEEHPLKSLRHELKLHGLAEEIMLEPFSEQEVADYVGARFPDVTAPESFVRRLHERTDGLPLFVVNVVDDLVGDGKPDGQQAIVASPVTDSPPERGLVPESLAGVIERQFARLSPEQRALLEAASVCGVEFRSGTVAAALERDAIAIAQQCDELARRQQWLASVAVERLADGTIDARYAFRHALYRQVLYQHIGALTCARLHRRVALSLERSRVAGVAVSAAELATHYERSHELVAALRHYADAAGNALRRFAPLEAMTLSAHALALLPRLSAGSERDRLEMELLNPRAVAASQLLGITAPETTSAFERIHVLSELVPDQTVRALEMAPGWVFHVRGDYDKARALATRKVALAERRGDRQLYVSASNLMGSTLAFQGDLAGGRRWFELSLAAFAEIADEVAQVSFVFDLGVSLHARLAQVLSHLGLVDQARAHRDAALARADALGQPYGRMFALVFAGQLAIRLDEPQRTLEWAESLEQAVTDQPVVEAQGFVRWLRGWALARSGQPESGLVLILEGYAYHLRLGRIGAGCAAILGYAAEALLQMARWNDAQARLDEALALARRLGERIYLPDLHCLEARVALGRGDAGAARASLQAALREARAQQALWLEMTALVALCELDGAAREDFTALAAARARLQEGTGTALVQRADVLLAAVAVESPTRQSTTARRRRGHDPK